MKADKSNSQKYNWGQGCLGWHLLNKPELSIIQETMPPQTEEVRHKHLISQQFFFVLKGVATFEVDGEITIVTENEGIHIQNNRVHQIKNDSNDELEFLVISQPHAHQDRVTIN